MHNLILYLAILTFSLGSLQATSTSNIQSLLKSGDFTGAKSLIEERLTNNPADSEASIYKCLADLGYFLESTLPSHLVANLNAKSDATNTAFDYDPSTGDIEANLISLKDSSDYTIGYWTDFENSAFPVFSSNGDIKSQNRFYNIFEWTLGSTTGNQFRIENNYFQANKNNSFISFTYTGDESKQCDFSINATASSGYLNFYLNGVYMGYISDSSFNYEIGDQYISGSGQMPLFLRNGDTVTFEAKTYSYENSDSFIGPGIMPNDLLHGSIASENGTGYLLTYPNLGTSITLKDIISILTESGLPVRNLLESLITNFGNVSIEDPVTIPASFTDYHSDILIQNEDAVVIQSLLKIINAFLGMADQYDFSLDYNYDTLSNLEIYKTAKAFFSSFPNIFESMPERSSDQADTQAEILSALTQIETILPLIWYRSPLSDPFISYLLSISDDLDNGNYAELNAQIDSLKASLSGFDRYTNLTRSQNGGFKYSLAPFVSDTPFSFKGLIEDMENDPEAHAILYGNDWGGADESNIAYKFLTQYGLVNDIFPMSMGGKVLVFKNANGIISNTILVNENSWNYLDYSPFSGELKTNQGEIFDNADYYNPIQLSYLSEGEGIWELNDSSGMGYTPEEGTFFYYNGALDLNHNGIPDGTEIADSSSQSEGAEGVFIKGNNLDYLNGLNSTLIQNAEFIRVQAAPIILSGLIAIEGNQSNGDDMYGNSSEEFYPYQVSYYISNKDIIQLEYEYPVDRDWDNYSYENGIITDSEDFDKTYLNFDSTYTATYFENDGETDKIVFYPSYLDLDNDGLSDGTEIIAGAIPEFIDYPSYNDIQNAITAYNENNEDGASNPINENSPINEDNPNALTDSDNDNMPDALELKFGGNPSNANDAQTSLDAIVLVDRYTINEISDLRLGSTLYEVSEGLASFNIILEETSDLTTWTPYGEYSMELSTDGNEQTKFYRFKMSE
ncbi:MAG: hypothetical protein P8I61_00330 [Opitutae bacterium]|nr:hypothetical protein [Opitutae bacterium]